MALAVEERRESGTCRCCMSEGTFESMDVDFRQTGTHEIRTYTAMLRHTFDVTLERVGGDGAVVGRLICGVCAMRLRDACAFKLQVSNAQLTLLRARFQELPEKRPITSGHCETEAKSAAEPRGAELTTAAAESDDDAAALSDLDCEVPLNTIPLARRDAPEPRIKDEKARRDAPEPGRIKDEKAKADAPSEGKRAEKQPVRGAGRRKGKSQPSDKEELCHTCGKVFKNALTVRRHIRDYHEEKRYYKCGMCPERFRASSYRRKHMADAHGVMAGKRAAFKCKECDAELATNQLRKEHMKEVHDYGLRATCSQCPQRFKNNYVRLKHLESVHGVKMETFPCGACDKVYKRQCILHLHQRNVHMMERNFPCPQCDSKFFAEKNLKAHMVKHGGERSFVCDVCKKTFPRRNTLLYHKRIHAGDKRSVCTICGSAFVQTASLKHHMTRHHPEA